MALGAGRTLHGGDFRIVLRGQPARAARPVVARLRQGGSRAALWWFELARREGALRRVAAPDTATGRGPCRDPRDRLWRQRRAAPVLRSAAADGCAGPCGRLRGRLRRGPRTLPGGAPEAVRQCRA